MGGTVDACLAVNPDCNLTRTHLTSALPIHPSPSRLDDDAWDDLLNFIEEKRVIPIIGPELLKVETDSGPRLQGSFDARNSPMICGAMP